METWNEFYRQLVAGELVSKDVIWWVLLGGMIFAGLHLVVMLITRWGDHQATVKSLIFSILVHLSCGIGFVTLPSLSSHVADSNQPSDQTEEQKEKEEEKEPQEKVKPFQFRNVQFVGSETFPTEQPGNTPTLPAMIEPTKATVTRQAPRAIVPKSLSENASVEREKPQIPNQKIPDTTNGLPKIRTVETPLDPTAALQESSAQNEPLVKTGTPHPTQKLPIIGEPNPNIPRKPQLPINKPPSTQIARIPTNPAENLHQENSNNIERHQPLSSKAPPAPLSTNIIPPQTLTEPQPHIINNKPLHQHHRQTAEVPATYQLRSLEKRKFSAKKHGGTDASEKAVEQALHWLAKNQNPAGYWDASAHGSGKVGTKKQKVALKKLEDGSDAPKEGSEIEIKWDHAGKDADTGITALALLAFLGAGYTHEEGPYTKTVNKALRWLIAQQTKDGFLGGKGRRYARMYCHGMATYAMAEAYAMQSDPTTNTRLRQPLEKAVAYLLKIQNKTDGGWRYMKGQEGDMSLFGWQLMALKSAEIAGLKIPNANQRLMVQFINAHSSGAGNGLASYQKNYQPSATMTAESLFCKQIFRIPRKHPACKVAVNYLLKQPPKQSELNLYYWYYGTLSMFQYGGPEWKKWNVAMRTALLNQQTTQGKNAGSWDPKGRWGHFGGRVFSTALSALCLEVYYRFLPLYKISGHDAVQANRPGKTSR